MHLEISQARFDHVCSRYGPSYAKALGRAIVERRENGLLVFDDQHAGWLEAQRIAEAHRRRQSEGPQLRRPFPGPGTCLARAIRVLSLGLLRSRPGCGCKARQERLDRLGWRGLFYGAMGLLGFVDRRWEAFRR